MEDLRRPKGKEQQWQGEHNTRGRVNKPFCPSVWLSEPWNLVPSFNPSVLFTSAFTEGPRASKEIRFSVCRPPKSTDLGCFSPKAGLSADEFLSTVISFT